MEEYNTVIGIIYSDGSRKNGHILVDDLSDQNQDLYRISLSYGDRREIAESDRGFFDALRRLRMELDKVGVLVCCFGASENVYPSPMQEAMGPAVLAYKNYLGKQAYSRDIVNIFESGEDMNPVTVEQQVVFHKKWLSSLGAL